MSFKTILFVFFILISIDTYAEKPRVKDTHIGIGAGVPYAGIIGIQITGQTENGRARVAFGLLGISMGYDYFISNKCALGVTGIYTLHLGDQFNGGAGLTCGFKDRNQGFNMSFELTSHQPDYSLNGDNGDLKTEVTPSISLGYRF